MAVAQVKYKDVVKTVQVNDGVILKLSEEEAVALRAVVGAVGGFSKHRDAITQIYLALGKAGFSKSSNKDVAEAVTKLEGTMAFRSF